MAKMIIVKSRTRNKLADDILIQINIIGQDKIIYILHDDGGKFAQQGGLLSVAKAYIYYKS